MKTLCWQEGHRNFDRFRVRCKNGFVPHYGIAALAGLIIAGDVRTADPHTAGQFSELDAILAVVIGGTSLFGGRFYLGLSVMGVLIIQSLLVGLYVSDMHPTANLVVKAVVVLAVLLLQSPEFRHFISQPFRRKTA